MILTNEEKKRFTDWLIVTGASSAGMIKQFELLGDPISLKMAERDKIICAACITIVSHLDSAETFNIDPDE